MEFGISVNHNFSLNRCDLIHRTEFVLIITVCVYLNLHFRDLIYLDEIDVLRLLTSAL